MQNHLIREGKRKSWLSEKSAIRSQFHVLWIWFCLAGYLVGRLAESSFVMHLLKGIKGAR